MPNKHATITLKSHKHLMAKLKDELNQRLIDRRERMLDKIIELRNENTKLRNENEKLKRRGSFGDVKQSCYGFAKLSDNKQKVRTFPFNKNPI